MRARIYQPARNAMQSGMAKTHDWVLEFAPDEARRVDPLMGWTGSGDTQAQVRLTFDSKEDADGRGCPFRPTAGWAYRFPTRMKPLLREMGLWGWLRGED